MQPLPRRSHYEVWERETDSTGGEGGVTGELQDTWEGIQRRLRGEHVHGCVSCKGVRSAGSGDKLEGHCVCVFRWGYW